MAKVIAGINMTLDGFCDHTAVIADEELHNYYTDLINNAGTLLYGRITYQLMEDYWPAIINNPTDNTALNEFAIAIDSIPKIIFSNTLQSTDWKSAKFANRVIEEVVKELKQKTNKNILIGSRSLIIQLINLNLIDEFHLCVHPVIAGKGLPLFENIMDRTMLKLTKTKTFSSGAITLYYEPVS